MALGLTAICCRDGGGGGGGNCRNFIGPGAGIDQVQKKFLVLRFLYEPACPALTQPRV